MSEQPNQSLARVLAPLALLVCAIAFFAVLVGSGGGDEGDQSSAAGTTEKRTKKKSKGKKQTASKATYTVKTGDTLGGIAAKAGVDVELLQTLNPELDPQALVAGQKIKLRE